VSKRAHLVLQQGANADAVRRTTAEVLFTRFNIDHVTLQTVATDCRTQGGSAKVHERI
jgi:hypothetical protein